MGKGIMIKGVDFSPYYVGLVQFKDKELFESILMHRWALDTDAVDDIGSKTLIDLNSGSLSISSGLTVNSGQKIYASLTDNLDTDNDGITICAQIKAVTAKTTDNTRIVYLCLGQTQGFSGQSEICLVSDNNNSESKYVLKIGSTDQFKFGTVKTDGNFQNIAITFSKTKIKMMVDGNISTEYAPAAGTNPLTYLMIYLGAYWTGISNVTDAHKIKNVRMYKKYMTNVELGYLDGLLNTL